MPNSVRSPRPTARCITYPRGFRVGSTTCGMKPSGQPDLAIIAAEGPASAAGVLTRSRTPGPPIGVCRAHLRSGRARAIVCNSGVANVATGDQGVRDARAMCDAVAEQLGCRRQEVLVCSTGVIGNYLPMAKLLNGIPKACDNLGAGRVADHAAAGAILTTDIRIKTAATRIAGSRPGAAGEIRLGGIAKGSGMIAPNMATMLAFLTTDAAMPPALLRRALRQAVAESFNRISVDGDTSTSDAVLILAGGASKAPPIRSTGRRFEQFTDHLTQVCQNLAWQIVADGEGATRVIRVQVRRAATVADADRVGRSVVNSPLVKTAIHGADPNWGRIVMAVGKSGARVVMTKLAIAIAGRPVFVQGTALRLTTAAQRATERAMKKSEVLIEIDLGLGKAEAQWLGCDLSRQYVAINADYTT